MEELLSSLEDIDIEELLNAVKVDVEPEDVVLFQYTLVVALGSAIPVVIIMDDEEASELLDKDAMFEPDDCMLLDATEEVDKLGEAMLLEICEAKLLMVVPLID